MFLHQMLLTPSIVGRAMHPYPVHFGFMQLVLANAPLLDMSYAEALDMFHHKFSFLGSIICLVKNLSLVFIQFQNYKNTWSQLKCHLKLRVQPGPPEPGKANEDISQTTADL